MNNKTKIKVGILISYDFNYVFNCIKFIYEHVDEIVLAVDKDRLTWSGNKFSIDTDFFDNISSIDFDNKIKVYQDKFYIESNTSMENETNERNMLSQYMGDDCWKLQIDSDEYVLEFDKIKSFLNKHSYFLNKPSQNPILLRGKWITLFKKLHNGYLYIDNYENFSFGTNLVGRYNFARNIDCKQLQTNFYAIHESWSRSEEELLLKIKNWGHNKDFDTDSFFAFWKSLDEQNYMKYKNFHPVYPQEWKELKFIQCNSLEDFISIYTEINKEVLSQETKVKSKYYFKYLKNKFF